MPFSVSLKLKIDPWTLAQRLSGEKHVFFLDSVRRQAKTARYSYLAWNPHPIFRSGASPNLLKRLATLLKKFKGRQWRKLPFLTSGLVGYFSYELGRALLEIKSQKKVDLGIDPAAFLLVRDLVVFDHASYCCYLISNLIPELDGTYEKALKRTEKVLEEMKTLINDQLCHPEASVLKDWPKDLTSTRSFAALRMTNKISGRGIQIKNFRSEVSKSKFKQMVVRAKEYIRKGDVYQVNLSQRFSFDFNGDAARLYEVLRKINPSPFSSFLKIGELTVASSSPERLIKKTGDECQTRPIAGTRPRGMSRREEQRFRNELITSAKERAEHVMLVDLERNDLGRVAEPESVRVSELMTLERYSHVFHIVSNVVGKLRKDCDSFDLFRAVFPGGTITGCPKIRAMQIIEELEPFRRHLYTGSIGYIDFNGDMDFNIVIRSLIFYRGKGYLQVGAGIVYDSDPEAEYWETLHKGKALIDALCETA